MASTTALHTILFRALLHIRYMHPHKHAALALVLLLLAFVNVDATSSSSSSSLFPPSTTSTSTSIPPSTSSSTSLPPSTTSSSSSVPPAPRLPPPCAGDAFSCCSLQGVYDSATQACICYPPWGGDNCTLLMMQDPVPFPSGYGMEPNRSSTWGGNIIPLVDANGTLEYHLFVAEMVNNCTLSAWSSNSQCVHAVSSSAEGPFTKVDVVLPAFCHNPEAVLFMNGTQQNIALFHIGDGTGHPKDCNSSAAASSSSSSWKNSDQKEEEDIVGVEGMVLSSPSFSTSPGTLHTAPGPSGPWTPVSPPPPSCNNPAPFVHPNGTFYLVCSNSGSIFPIFSAPSIEGPWREIGGVPTTTPYAGTAEDPFLYMGRNGTWHLLAHMWTSTIFPTCDNTTVSAHFYSLDGHDWRVQPVQPYGSEVVFDGWRGAITVPTRERPKLLFGLDGLTPTHLVNGVAGGASTCPPYWCSHCKILEWTFTLVQPLQQQT